MKTFNEKALYTYKFIGECLPIYAFYTILFLDRGKTVSDIAILIALWSLFSIAFDIPAGILADRWNRRNMLAVASILQGICFVIWFFSHTFFMFAIGFLFWAIAGAFTSGTEESLIYDNLKSDGNEDSFTKIYGNSQFFATIGALVGIAKAGLIAIFISIEAIALISAVICFVNVIFALQIRERNFYLTRKHKESTGVFDTFKNAIFFVKGSGFAIVTILFMVLFASLGLYLDEFDALIANNWDISELWVSGILFVRFAFVALGDIIAPIIEKKISSIRQIFLINVLACIMLTIFALIWNWYAILLFGISFMLMTVSQILLVNILQNEIKEEGRATVMSFFSVGQNIAMIILSLIFALLASIFTLQQVYIIISIYGIVGSLVFCLLFIKIRTKRA